MNSYNALFQKGEHINSSFYTGDWVLIIFLAIIYYIWLVCDSLLATVIWSFGLEIVLPWMILANYVNPTGFSAAVSENDAIGWFLSIIIKWAALITLPFRLDFWDSTYGPPLLIYWLSLPLLSVVGLVTIILFPLVYVVVFGYSVFSG